MNVEFNVSYRTKYGENLFLCVLGNDENNITKYPMGTGDGENWSCCLKFSSPFQGINYFYCVENNGNIVREEWNLLKHRIVGLAKKKKITVYNRWNSMPEDSYRYSSAFTDCITCQIPTAFKSASFAKTIRFIVRSPQLNEGETLGILGENELLGEWNPQKTVMLQQCGYNVWTIDIDADELKGNCLEFKFVAYNEEKERINSWECCDNRVVHFPNMDKGEMYVYELDQAFFPYQNRRFAGTLVPVFSLRSKDSFGVGDFGDLKKMIDFLAVTDQRVLQILPVNDTCSTHTWKDSYPYKCISIFALHPQYISLKDLPRLKDKKRAAYFEERRKELNALKQIDYEKVNDTKIDYLKELYLQEGKKMLNTKEFMLFFEDTKFWLTPYSYYSYLRDKYGTAEFSQWPKNNTWNESDRGELENPKSEAYENVVFFYFLQFILDQQLKEVHEYCKRKGVILKGDIPIGVSRFGCDVWMEPRYFNLNGQAGAPPDDFSVDGQNWGFPTYNWEAMVEDNCMWWVRRFKNMSKYFDAYRIDHVLGFFRIWEIPISSVNGILGQFAPSLGMTRDEVESYGLIFQEERFTQPFITDWIIDRVFKEKAALVRNEFVERIGDERYALKSHVDTQRKIESYFGRLKENGELTEELNTIRDGLFSLVSDVLFVRDTKNPNLFHPRISAQFSFIYESLWDSDKFVFNRLYNEYYYHRHNQFWYDEAMKKLPKLVQATRMLVCAEDLGMIPDSVQWVMNEMRILSLEIQSMPKDPNVKFGHLDRNPYRSVCTISSHDMPTLRQWWEEDKRRTQEYYAAMLYRSGEAPQVLSADLARDIIGQHLNSPSMLCVLSIQDWLAIDCNLRNPNVNAERINIPAIANYYWRYRMHINIEDLIGNKEYVGKVKEMISASNRT